MKKHLIRIVALVWLSGTLYVSFLLFSGGTMLNSIAWNGELNSRGVGLDRVELPTVVEQKNLVQKDKWDVFKEKNSLNPLQPGQSWEKYTKYRNNGSRRLWPLVNDREDRVLDQIHNIPFIDRNKPPKLILMRWGMDGMPPGRKQFVNNDCPVDWCALTSRMGDEPRADLIFYKDEVTRLSGSPRNPNQVSLLFMLESPMHTSGQVNPVNWTATYRSDSVLNTPYERFAFYKNFTKPPTKPSRNFASGKTKMVAWFVSNCYTTNGRLYYAEELAKYIQVDIFGLCGKMECVRDTLECSEMLKREYKFYLSFENSNCQDYITEKFFVNALSNDVIPIVMGARPEDYKKLAPPNSYIHVDDFDSPELLAEYLHKLDQDDDLYNSYFLWKSIGEFIDTKFWCRLCALLHERDHTGVSMWYTDLNSWWNGPGVCISLQEAEGSENTWVSWNNYTGPRSDTTGTYKLLKNKGRRQ